MYLTDKLKFVGKIKKLNNSVEFRELCDKLYKKRWVSYVKKSFGEAGQVIDYLGRYTHRVAISNERVMKLEDDKVTFRYRDYRDRSKNKTMTLDVFEFIRRFLLHILPDKYMKIRYYGLFSNRNRKKKLNVCKKILGSVDRDKENLPKSESWQELLFRLTGEDPRICPCCSVGQMVTKDKLLPISNAPPLKIKAVF